MTKYYEVFETTTYILIRLTVKALGPFSCPVELKKKIY